MLFGLAFIIILTKKIYSTCSLAELKEELGKRKASTIAKKAALIERLEAYDRNNLVGVEDELEDEICAFEFVLDSFFVDNAQHAAASSCQRLDNNAYDCGRVTPQSNPLVVGGNRARHGELPWHVGVYQKTSYPYRQICGGSIVSRNLVISAAHCFWNPSEKLTPALRYAVAAGKIYKPWDESHDPDAQHSNVSELLVPPLFRGVDRNFAEDLALLVLAQPFQYRPYLRPVCLDFEPHLEELQLRPGTMGKVAGWGLTTASGKQTTVLNVVDLPVVATDECLNKSPQNYWEYITNDKICAGYDNGKTTLCQGDSGGGLAFPHSKEPGIVRYYLRGVVSTSPSSNSLCNTFAITSFTKISVHRKFIELRYRQEVVEPAAPLDVDADPTEDTCILPPYPLHGRWVVELNGQLQNVKPGDVRDAQLRYFCDPGYQLTGALPLNSCAGGLWQHRPPKCTPSS